jgi:hypothetical protein
MACSWKGIGCRMASMVIVGLMHGCVTQSGVQTIEPVRALDVAGGSVAIRLERCTDRTSTRERDLAAEAGALIAEGLRAMPNVRVSDDAPLILNCEVTHYAEGSAVKRWLMPGWGATVGQVALMVSKASDQSAVVIVQGNSTVSAGGLYTLGAETYILKSAIDDALAKLRAWAQQAQPAGDRP